MNEDKPENSFNIAKDEELELITLCHFENIISPKPIWNSQWWNQPICTSPIFQIFFEKKDFLENAVNLHMAI